MVFSTATETLIEAIPKGTYQGMRQQSNQRVGQSYSCQLLNLTRGEQKENVGGGVESSSKSECTEEGNNEISGHIQRATEEEEERDLPSS